MKPRPYSSVNCVSLGSDRWSWHLKMEQCHHTLLKCYRILMGSRCSCYIWFHSIQMGTVGTVVLDDVGDTWLQWCGCWWLIWCDDVWHGVMVHHPCSLSICFSSQVTFCLSCSIDRIVFHHFCYCDTIKTWQKKGMDFLKYAKLSPIWEYYH